MVGASRNLGDRNRRPVHARCSTADSGRAEEVIRYELVFASASTARTSTSDQAIGALDGAVEDVLKLDSDALTDGDLRTAMVGLRRAEARLAAAVTELTAEFDARRVWADDGSRGAADWLSHHAHRPRSEVASDVRVGRRLRNMPLVREAWRAGDVAPAHARLLARLAGHPRAGAAFPDSEPMLVDHARRLRFDDFERTTRYWLQAADPDGPERDRRRDLDLRRFSLDVGIDGVGHADGRFTALGAATVGATLEGIEQELFEADLAEARSRLGDTATAADLARTPAQRRHDALVEMAIRSTTAPADAKRPAALVTVMVGYETFAGRVLRARTRHRPRSRGRRRTARTRRHPRRTRGVRRARPPRRAQRRPHVPRHPSPPARDPPAPLRAPDVPRGRPPMPGRPRHPVVGRR